MIRRIFRRLATSAFIGGIVYIVIALGMIASQSPSGSPGADRASMDFSGAVDAKAPAPAPFRHYKARNGDKLAYRLYTSTSPTKRLIILLHGSGWHGLQFDTLARFLSTSGLGNVAVPDLRGHGFTPKRRGDIDYIGQMEDDIADLITHLRSTTPVVNIVLGGHSSGGGLAVRFAGGGHGNMVDGWLLMAPFLKYNAPTTRPNSGGWARPLNRRIIGLAMLHQIGINLFGQLPVIEFSMPRNILALPLGETATLTYSYRLLTSFGPRDDYEKDLRAISKPLLVVAGTADEAFFADRYKEVISAQTNYGEYALLDGVTHLGVAYGPEVRPVIARWLRNLP